MEERKWIIYKERTIINDKLESLREWGCTMNHNKKNSYDKKKIQWFKHDKYRYYVYGCRYGKGKQIKIKEEDEE